MGTSLSPPVASFAIYADEDDATGYWFMANRLAAWIRDLFPSVALEVHDLALIGTHPNAGHIVIGNPSISTVVQGLADTHGLSTLDLGTEGYELDSRPFPGASPEWRVLIVSNHPHGARYAVATLLQEIDPTQQVFREVLIRDYPNRPHRAYSYQLSTIGWQDAWIPVPTWMAARFADIDKIAQTGVNAIVFGGADWFRLDQEITSPGGGGYYGDRMKELFDYCGLLGIVPIPQIMNQLSNFNRGSSWDSLESFTSGPERALWREGKFINGERFVAIGGQYLQNVLGNFDNVAENLTWQCVDWPMEPCAESGGRIPCQWTKATCSGGSAPGWCWGEEPGFTLDGYPPATSVSAAVQTTVPIVSGSFYVLRVTVERSTWEGSGGTVQIFVKQQSGPCDWPSYYKYFRLTQSDDAMTYELPFLVPPGSAPGDIVDIGIVATGVTSPSILVSSFSLDRRDAGFINLMRAPGVGGYPGLGLKVLSDDRTIEYIEGVDYIVETVGPQLDWRMPSSGPVSQIRWLAPGGTPTTVRVYCTLGVPADHPGGNTNATTFCFSNGALYNEYTRVFEDILGPAPNGFDLDPPIIQVDLDEVRGMNRCGRCVLTPQNPGRGKTNSEYLNDHITTLQSIVSTIPGAEQTRLAVYADMLSPAHNGSNADGSHNQYTRWLGQQGATTVAPEALDQDLILQMWEPDLALQARNQGWPGAAIDVIASPYTGDTPEDWAKEATWYEPKSLGFWVHQYSRFRLPSASDIRMFDYAWKRYANPDATLHGFVGTQFKTDEVGDHVVVLDPGQPLTVRPYGRAELRDPGNQTATIQSATINWGDGSPVTNVDPVHQLNSASFNHVFVGPIIRTVTLTVFANTGEGQRTAEAKIRARSSGCTKNCPTPTQGNLVVTDFSPGIRAIQPNPFTGAAAIHFGVQEATEPELRIFDVQGRRVLEERLAEHSPGLWQWSWDGLDDKGLQAGAGVYFVQLRVGPHLETRRIVKLAR